MVLLVLASDDLPPSPIGNVTRRDRSHSHSTKKKSNRGAVTERPRGRGDGSNRGKRDPERKSLPFRNPGPTRCDPPRGERRPKESTVPVVRLQRGGTSTRRRSRGASLVLRRWRSRETAAAPPSIRLSRARRARELRTSRGRPSASPTKHRRPTPPSSVDRTVDECLAVDAPSASVAICPTFRPCVSSNASLSWLPSPFHRRRPTLRLNAAPRHVRRR